MSDHFSHSPQTNARAEIEALIITVVFAYQTTAMLLRRTRWTKYVPPISRKLTDMQSEIGEDLVLSLLKLHWRLMRWDKRRANSDSRP